MPTFAILGATGHTGQCILSLLLKDASATIHCYVRNAKKLSGLSPELRENKRVRIFEAPLNDISALADCIAPCDALFSCIATEENAPGTTIALDTAHSVVAALTHIRCVHQSHAPLPRIIVLSSGTTSDHLTRETPTFARNFVWCGFSHIYADLIRAEAYYRMHRTWMTAIFVLPGGLVQDKQSGHAVDTEKESGAFLSYLDLAAGMIECGSKAKQDTEWDWVSLSVVPTGKTKFNFRAPFAVLRGCMWTILPPLYWALHWAGAV
jgi:hypothetical protein